MRRRAARHQQAGFTLLEIMVVMAIMAVVLGMSTAFLQQMNRGYKFTSAAAKVVTTIRQARNFSLASRTYSQVVIDAKTGWIQPLGQKPVAVWHLETGTEDASGGHALGGTGDPTAGKVGNAVLFASAGQFLDAGRCNKFGAQAGVSISAWFYGMSNPTGILFDFGGALKVEWLADGAVQATGPSGDVKTPEGVFVPGRWTKVEVVYDRELLVLAIDGVRMAAKAGNEPMQLSAASFTIGHAKKPYIGKVDEVQLAAIIRPDRVVLSDGIELKRSPRVIRFDRQGNLDPLTHAGDQRIWIFSKSEARWRLIEVSLGGRVRMTEPEEGPGPDPNAAPAKGPAGATK